MNTLEKVQNQKSCDDRLSTLDSAYALFREDDKDAAFCAMDTLVSALQKLRQTSNFNEWNSFRALCCNHPVSALVLQDPLTAWSFRKPRGYAGDAKLLDFIYRHDDISPELSSASDLGRSIYAYTYSSSAGSAVRERRSILASRVDETATAEDDKIEVLAVAAGHLRESEESKALSNGQIARWTALDQDKDTITLLDATKISHAIQPLKGSVRGLLSRRYHLGTLDVIYAAGLFDYLEARVAARLTETAFSMLKPGGTLLYANFAVDSPDSGYLEAFMGWELIFRTDADMIQLSAGIPEDRISQRELFRGTNRNVIYVKVKKLESGKTSR
jgi:hypothetical protein